jgi:hypothetical protein
MGQYSLAEEHYKKTLDRDPNHTGAMEDWEKLALRRSSPHDPPPQYIEIIKKPVVKRADMAALLARDLPLEKICQKREKPQRAEDISDHWASREMNDVIACGLMSPFDDGTFRPHQSVTRRECAGIMDHILQENRGEDWIVQQSLEEVAAIPDVPSDDVHLEAIRLVISLGIMELRKNGSFEPNKEVNGHTATKMVQSLREFLLQ